MTIMNLVKTQDDVQVETKDTVQTQENETTYVPRTQEEVIQLLLMFSKYSKNFITIRFTLYNFHGIFI